MHWTDARKSREYTCRVLEAVDEGLLDPKSVLEMALSYMSETEVEDMCRVNDILDILEVADDDDDEIDEEDE
jgi:hypothetical protein